MSDRTFPEIIIPAVDPAYRHRLAFRITCGDCGTEAFFPVVSSGGHRRPPIAAEQHFQHAGWVVGSSHRKDRCPKHAFSKKEKPMPSKLAAAIEAAGPAEPPKAEPPREMTREDRRIIMERLDEVYAKESYKTPWTDAGVAKDLGVPRQWVVDVRDQFFGPEGSNPLFEEFAARLDKVGPDVVSIGDKAKSLFDQVYQLRQQVEDITKEFGDLKRIGGRIERELGR